MKYDIKPQMERVDILSEMVKENLFNYVKYDSELEKWRTAEPRNWNDRPQKPSQSSIKRLTLVLRQELLKLEKMI